MPIDQFVVDLGMDLNVSVANSNGQASIGCYSQGFGYEIIAQSYLLVQFKSANMSNLFRSIGLYCFIEWHSNMLQILM